MKLRALGIIIVLAGATALGCVSAQASTRTTTRIIPEKVVIYDPGSDHGNQFLVEDKNRAPMFWVNMFGAQSGAEPICAMDFKLRPVVCIGGKFGQYGASPEIVFYRNGKVSRIIR